MDQVQRRTAVRQLLRGGRSSGVRRGGQTGSEFEEALGRVGDRDREGDRGRDVVGQGDSARTVGHPGDGSEDFDAAVKALSETFAGQAAAAAETFAGRMSRVQIAVDEAKEQIGFALLPFMEKLAKFVTDNLVPALEGLVNGLTRTGKQGLTKAFYDAGTGAVTFGYDLESTEGQAYLLGEQIRQLGDAIGKLLAIDPSTGDSLLIKLIDSLTKIIEKTEAAVRAFERFKESFVGGAILDIATAPIRSAGALASGNPGQVININNTFGATNSKAQAQTVVKSINNAAKAGTVNKFVKPMIQLIQKIQCLWQ